MEIFDYDHIFLLPRKCMVQSRSECDASVQLGPRRFRMPVVPSNIKPVVNDHLCAWLGENGYFYVRPRFAQDLAAFVQHMQEQNLFASISVGVRQADYDALKHLLAADLIPEYVSIDIAHGHAKSVQTMITYLKEKMPASFIIAGNVATAEAVIDLENWGADATKVGIHPKEMSMTKTGFGTSGWQLSAMQWCAHVANKPIIADGNIRTHGDIAKSIRFGATMVMPGFLLADYDENPGETRERDGVLCNTYCAPSDHLAHSNHKQAQERMLQPLKASLADMEQDIQSAISYAGGRELMDIRKADYILLDAKGLQGHLRM